MAFIERSGKRMRDKFLFDDDRGINISIEHWWNDTDRAKLKSS